MFNPSDLIEDHHLQRFSPPLPGPTSTVTDQQSHAANVNANLGLASRDRDLVHVQAQAHAQAQVAQLLREREREQRDGQKHGSVGVTSTHPHPQSYRDIFDMGGVDGVGVGASGDRLVMRDVPLAGVDGVAHVPVSVPRGAEELAIHRTNSNVNAVNGGTTTDYSEFDQFLQSTNWARGPNSNSHGHGHGHGHGPHGGHGHGGHEFQNPSNGMSRPAPNAHAYPNAAMFMMGAGNMNMANMNMTAANMNMAAANMSNMGMFNGVAPMPFSMNPMMYQQHQNSLYRHEGNGGGAGGGGSGGGNGGGNGSSAPKVLPLPSSTDKKKKILHAPSNLNPNTNPNPSPAGAGSVAAGIAAIARTHTHTPAAKPKATKKETKRRRKKPKDCPRRPLSAYNLFFKDERKRILNAIPGESEEMKKKKEDEKPEITWPGKKKTPHRKIGFENLAKRIGQAWKDIDPEQLKYYKDLAVQDLQRYADEMKRYEKRLSFRKYCSDSDEDEESHSHSHSHSRSHSNSPSRKEKRKIFNTNTIDNNDSNNKRRHENYD